MYYATKRKNTQQRVIGLAGVVVAIGGAGYALANGLGIIDVKERVETEVVMIEEVVEDEDEPPPPPPVDVDLPPPPPQVILPDFVFETPPPQEAAVTQVAPVRNPAPPPPPAVRPPAPPAITVRSKPKPGRRFEKPEYPSAARRAGEEGEVVVSVCVAADGRMSNIQLVKSSGFPRLDEATLKGLPRTRLDPAVGTDGKPMEMCNPPYVMTLVWDLEEAR
jgi:protein TonB